jgi:hypothetical protein
MRLRRRASTPAAVAAPPRPRGLLVDHPTMRGWHRQGRAPRRDLRAARLNVDPPLTVVGHSRALLDDDGNVTGRAPVDQPTMRAARAAFRNTRREARAAVTVVP